jgi:ribosomal protein S27E
MNAAVEARSSSVLQVRCVHCGSVQEVPLEAREATCQSCSEALRGPSGTSGARADSGSRIALFQVTVRMAEALAELIKRGPGGEVLDVVVEILTFQDRMTSVAAFVPFLGPWLVARSEARPDRKFKLQCLSTGLTVLTLIGMLGLARIFSAPPVPLHERLQAQIATLGDIARDFRAKHGAYPDTATWKRTAEEPDLRFIDPWSRPYRYELARDGGVTIGTLGRDGKGGGSGDDEDVSVHFVPPQPAPSR